jgi:hypothetical protein
MICQELLIKLLEITTNKLYLIEMYVTDKQQYINNPINYPKGRAL